MHREGHYGAALVAYAPLGFVVIALGYPTAAVGGGALALVLAMLPDWDQRIPGVPHRGPTHTVGFAGVVALATALLAAGVVGSQAGTGAVEIVAGGAFGAAVGGLTIGSHIGADALTPMGVEPLGEDGPHITYRVCRADSTLGNYGLLALGVAAALVAFYAGRGLHAAVA
jgi:inner membrane protein